jgi:hypothetical protein
MPATPRDLAIDRPPRRDGPDLSNWPLPSLGAIVRRVARERLVMRPDLPA